MRTKRSAGEVLFDSVNVILMVFLSLIFLAPFLHVIFASVSDPIRLMSFDGIVLWPVGGFTLKGYFMVFSNRNIYTGYMNTLLYVSIGTLANLFFTSIMAYVLSRKKVLWRNAMMFFLVFTMFFRGGLIPLYLQVRNLGLYNNRLVMILLLNIYTGIVSVWNLIIMRTCFLALPESLSESARIDGAGHLTILFRIIIPLSKAVLSVIALFYAVDHWNEWFTAAIFLRDRDKYPMQLILREILILEDKSTKSDSMVDVQSMDYYESLVKYCTIIVATVPILVIYPFIQKYFAKGIMVGSIKG